MVAEINGVELEEQREQRAEVFQRLIALCAKSRVKTVGFGGLG